MLCTSCKKDLPVTQFRKSKHYIKRNGYAYRCKGCDQKYKHTENGHMTKIYHALKFNNGTRGFKSVDFTKADFIKWCNSNGFSKLYNKWSKGKFVPNEAPSVDRISDSKPYQFDNMKLVTWKDNHSKNTDSMSKAVEQLDSKGKVIKTFKSVRDAGRNFSEKSEGAGIMNALKDQSRTAYGYKWRYYD